MSDNQLPDKEIVPKEVSYFNLETSSSDDESVEKLVSPTTSVFSSDAKPSISHPDKTNVINFWDKNCDEVDDWHKPESVWSAPENKDKFWACYKRKWDTIDEEVVTKRVKNSENMSVKNANRCINEKKVNNKNNILKKSPYYIHSQISAFINQSDNLRTLNKIPSQKFIKLTGHIGAVNRINWCDPQFSHLMASAGMDKSVKIWNIYSTLNNCVKNLCIHSKAVKDVCWSHTGKQVLSCGFDKTAIITDVETGVPTVQCRHENFLSISRYHPVNHNYIISGSKNKLICWDIRSTERPALNFSNGQNFGQVNDISFCHNGNEFFACNDQVSRSSSDKNIMVWDFKSGAVLSTQVYQERFTCTRLKTHSNAKEILAQSQGNYIAAFSTSRPYKLNKYRRYEGHKVTGYNIGFDISTDGNLIASGSSDGSVFLYNYKNGRKLHTIKLEENDVGLDIAWHPVLNSTLAVSTWGGEIHILR